MEYNVIDDTERMTRVQKQLEDIAKKFGISKKHVFFKTGYPADEIKQFADDIDADIIVIGTHGRSGFKLILGSTANAVLHGVKRDILAVRIHDNE
jgi:universal stress protein A